MSLKKQAKVLTKEQQEAVLRFLETTRHPFRNKLIFPFSIRAGLRAKEVASITWAMVTNANGEISDEICLRDIAAKGNSGGVIPMNKGLKDVLNTYFRSLEDVELSNTIIATERGAKASPQVIVNMMRGWYLKLGFNGCSSHSGRRTFITSLARRISSVDGSMRDVQMLARHASLQQTQKYIDANCEAQKKVVQLV